MKRTQDICRLAAIVCSMVFVWAIAAELDLVPRLVRSDILRWQTVLVAGIALWVFADHLADLRCRCCGSDEVLLRSLASSREVLCRRCLFWNPGTLSSSVVPILTFERLNPPLRLWSALWLAALGRPVRVVIRMGRVRLVAKALPAQRPL